MATLASYVLPPRASDETPSANSSSSMSNARLTPDLDSDSDLETDALGESYKLQRRTRDAEKAVESDDDEDLDEGEYEDRSGRRASVSTTHSYQLYTPDEERAVVKKFDRKLVLFVALLYMLSFLDRSSMLLF